MNKKIPAFAPVNRSFGGQRWSWADYSLAPVARSSFVMPALVWICGGKRTIIEPPGRGFTEVNNL